MKKSFRIIILLLLSTITVQAQNLYKKYERVLTQPRMYTCYRTSDNLKIDGKLNEKGWKDAPFTESFVDISGEGFAEPKYDTKAKMLWDDNYLYVGALLEEDDIKAKLTKRDTIIYYDNDFEVFIDPDGDGHNYFEIETNARGVVFDLMLDKPYRSGGNFMVQWDCPGLKLAIHRDGTLNKGKDKDKYWSVEMAIPREALTMNFNNTLKAGNCWRINFSRVQWLKEKGPEENWVWSPTGKIDMHMPDRWGYLYFSDKTVGSGTDNIKLPYSEGIYKLIWSMFYAQQNNYACKKSYIKSIKGFDLTSEELNSIPANAKIDIEATNKTYVISISDPENSVVYYINNEGRFWSSKLEPREVKNWVWTGINSHKDAKDWKEWFSLLKECGISAVLFGGYNEDIFKMCKEAGLEAHQWIWTMNRGEVRNTHPDWFAVNRNGESCYDKPPYVKYYNFICPNHPGVASYLTNDYVTAAHKPYVDGVHLDYVRMPDVILPVGLWKNYRIEQKEEYPQYDYCYCDVCRSLFKKQTGKDPMEIEHPMENQSWLNFRLNSITKVVDSITTAVKKDNKFISAAVFPGPTMAKKMVRQDWGNWSLDAYFPMIYNKFYLEEVDWIGESVKESVQTVNGKAKIYAGLMFGDIKDDFEAALDAAFDNGASGVSFFDGPNTEYLKKFKTYLEKRNFKVK